MASFAEIEKGKVVNILSVGEGDLLNPDGERKEALGVAYLQNLLGSNRNFVETFAHSGRREIMARIGFLYDIEKDVFVDPHPSPHWSEL